MKIRISFTDDDGHVYEGEFPLKKSVKNIVDRGAGDVENWYKRGSTIEKIISLINKGFFSTNRTLTDIIKQLESLDYHFKSPDLTLPLRKIVRHNLLKRTKDLPNNQKSDVWTYVEF